MFKTFVTLMRGRAFQAEERVKDQNALALLDQQMRDAAGAVDRAKRALAVAIAKDKQEEQRLVATRRQMKELEQRAVAALQGRREDLAQKAAEAIAALEKDAGAAQKARDYFGAEIAKLERHVSRQAARLTDLERGRRVAGAAQAMRVARAGRVEPAPCFEGTLSEAETTLERLRAQQTETEAMEAALDAMDTAHAGGALAETMAAQGFGPPTAPCAADVFARMKEKAAAPRQFT
jgi:phage shock protein A